MIRIDSPRSFKRWPYSSGTVLLAVTLAGLWLDAGNRAVAAEPSGRPNLVFILADDLGYGDLGCYGQKLIQTPHIDRLAAQGIRFTQAYAGSTVRAPSRCSLMTGMHNGHNRVRDNVPHYEDGLQDEDVTIAEVLRQVGYRCGGVGKWSLGNAGTSVRATNQGFDRFLGYLDQDHAHYYYTDYLDDSDGRLELPDDEPYTKKPWSQREKNYAAMITRMDRDVGRIGSPFGISRRPSPNWPVRRSRFAPTGMGRCCCSTSTPTWENSTTWPPPIQRLSSGSNASCRPPRSRATTIHSARSITVPPRCVRARTLRRL